MITFFVGRINRGKMTLDEVPERYRKDVELALNN